ncbi:thiamine pyrophosphokinase-like protein 1 [Dendryphion nanum]|uniref:Thiamine pyrophosphokinase n=1 Tax=Dendryphion nanum TaxID=256645 RepID=A0A9P9E1A2_9PLEO|nr:thiamine pyrophosphokinase-like protein 1 [Dendryphion nanum]
MNPSGAKEFSPGLFLASGELPIGANAPDLLILNQPIASFALFSRLWKHSRYRICADGGANRLFDMFTGAASESRRADYLPGSIHGDLDSLRDDVRGYYTAQGVDVSQDHDQFSTDFGKAMQKIIAQSPGSSQRDILVLGTLSGRVDQGLGLLHEMLREEMRDSTLRLWLFSETNVSFILRDQRNYLRGMRASGLFAKYVGLVPVYGPARISTEGLEWDVKDWETQMGGQVSTSNHIVADDVGVQTTTPILFTVQRMPFEEGDGNDVVGEIIS